MNDDIYLVYYNDRFLGMLSDSESFWYLYEWLSESNGVCNVITLSKKDLEVPQDFCNFHKMVARYGEVTISSSKMCIELLYNDDLI